MFWIDYGQYRYSICFLELQILDKIDSVILVDTDSQLFEKPKHLKKINLKCFGLIMVNTGFHYFVELTLLDKLDSVIFVDPGFQVFFCKIEASRQNQSKNFLLDQCGYRFSIF